jgi:hypothetical protein
MKNYTFYQLLDRELPRSIIGASRLLITSEMLEEEASACGDGSIENQSLDQGTESRQSILQAIYPMMSGRNCSVDPSACIEKLSEVREALGQMSLAYAISEYEPFAVFAERLVREELIAKDLFCIDDINEGFSLQKKSSSNEGVHQLMVEVILGLEMIQRLGFLGSSESKLLRYAIYKRLRSLERKSIGSLNLSEQLGCLLEQILLSLYLGDFEAFEKVGYLFQKRYFEVLPGKESIVCIDNYFAICYWIDQGQDNQSGILENAFNKLRSENGRSKANGISRGAWVSDGQESRFETILRESSVLLLFGESMNRPDMIDGWIERIENATKNGVTESKILTRPLLWFGSEEWGYRPFKRTSGIRNFRTSRL